MAGRDRDCEFRSGIGDVGTVLELAETDECLDSVSQVDASAARERERGLPLGSGDTRERWLDVGESTGWCESFELFEDELVDWCRAGEPKTVSAFWDGGLESGLISELGRDRTVLNHGRNHPIIPLSESLSLPLTGPEEPRKGSRSGRIATGCKLGLGRELNFSSKTDRSVRNVVWARESAVDGREGLFKSCDAALRGDFKRGSTGCFSVGGVIGRGAGSGTGGSLRPGGKGIGRTMDTGESAGCQSCGGSDCGIGCTTGSGLGDRRPRAERSTSIA